jgi:hypothetical protein
MGKNRKLGSKSSQLLRNEDGRRCGGQRRLIRDP